MEYILTGKNKRYYGNQRDNILEFLGIKYSEPVGFWQEPRLIKYSKNQDILAHSFSNTCIQPFEASEPSSWNKEQQSNDCLTLNIWTKNSGKKNKPVMVYIHGGTYVNGSNRDLTTCGFNFLKNLPVEEDAVIVNINYRLGIFGCMDLSVLDGYEEKYKNSSVLWILDQITALKWINENIEDFGGNKNNITLFGQSAGSMSIAYLMAVKEARQYFNRGIMQSGTPFFAISTKAEKKELARSLFKELGVDTIAELLEKDDAFWKENYENIFSKFGMHICTRVADGAIIPEDFYQQICNGSAAEIELMVGATTGEMDGCAIGYRKAFEENFKEAATELIGFSHQPYGFPTDSISFIGKEDVLRRFINKSGDKLKAVMDIINFFMNQQGSRLYAIAQSKWNENTYLYYWNWMPDPQLFVSNYEEAKFSYWNRAPHCAELPVVFGTGETAYDSFNLWWLEPYKDFLIDKPQFATVPDELAKKTCLTWYSFAKNGNPNNHLICYWQKYDISKDNFMFMDEEFCMKTIKDLFDNIDMLHEISIDNVRNTELRSRKAELDIDTLLG